MVSRMIPVPAARSFASRRATSMALVFPQVFVRWRPRALSSLPTRATTPHMKPLFVRVSLA
jgi:hypothetical protein